MTLLSLNMRDGLISCLWCLLVFDYEDMVLMAGGLVVLSSKRQNRRTFLVNSLILPPFTICNFSDRVC